MDQAEEMVDDEMLVMEVEGVLVIGYVGGVTHKSTFESSCHCFWRGILVPAVEVAVVVHKLLSLFACSWVVVPLWLFCLLELGRAGGLGTLRVRSCHDISLSLSLSFFLVLDCSVWKCVCVCWDLEVCVVVPDRSRRCCRCYSRSSLIVVSCCPDRSLHFWVLSHVDVYTWSFYCLYHLSPCVVSLCELYQLLPRVVRGVHLH